MAKSKGNKAAVPSPSARMTAEDKRWRARNDADTLRAAGEIVSDRSRIAAARVELTKGLTAISKLAKGK